MLCNSETTPLLGGIGDIAKALIGGGGLNDAINSSTLTTPMGVAATSNGGVLGIQLSFDIKYYGSINFVRLRIHTVVISIIYRHAL